MRAQVQWDGGDVPQLSSPVSRHIRHNPELPVRFNRCFR